MFIGGGRDNLVCSNYSSVLGGCNNDATAGCSAVLGGSDNVASHTNSMIAGNSITTQIACALHVNNIVHHAHHDQTPYIGTAEAAGELIFIGSSLVTAGNLYYLAEGISGTSGWIPADADAASSSTNMLAMAVGTGTSHTVGMLIRGFARFTSVFGLTGATMGAPLYVSTTAGGITTGAPSGTGDVVRVVGHVIDDATEVIYFNPDGAWVEIA